VDDLILRNIHVWKATNPPRVERAADAGNEKTETFYGENAWMVRTQNVRSGAITSAMTGENRRLPTEPNTEREAKIDLELPLDFNVDPGSSPTTSIQYKAHAQVVYLDNPSGSPTEYDINAFTHIRYYSYQAGAESSDYDATTSGASANCIRDYLADLYRIPRHALEREYDSCKADDGSIDSHITLQPYRRITVNQGDATRTFYAKRVTKNINLNTAVVEWLEE